MGRIEDVLAIPDKPRSLHEKMEISGRPQGTPIVQLKN